MATTEPTVTGLADRLQGGAVEVTFHVGLFAVVFWGCVVASAYTTPVVGYGGAAYLTGLYLYKFWGYDPLGIAGPAAVSPRRSVGRATLKWTIAFPLASLLVNLAVFAGLATAVQYDAAAQLPVLGPMAARWTASYVTRLVAYVVYTPLWCVANAVAIVAVATAVRVLSANVRSPGTGV